MRCPYCGFLDSRVIDKRATSDYISTRRRRECLSCHKRFSTQERVESVDLLVIKNDGRREPFNPEKLRSGLYKAFQKRQVGSDEIDQIVSSIEQELRIQKITEVSAKLIGQIVMRRLKKVDHIAYIRFASVYKNFTEVKDFQEALKDLIPERRK
jgi:transcriptional repressor NrdR